MNFFEAATFEPSKENCIIENKPVNFIGKVINIAQ